MNEVSEVKVELLPKDFTKGFSRLKLLEVECANSGFYYFWSDLTNWLNHILKRHRNG